MSEENEKKFSGPVKVPVGKHLFRLTGAAIKPGKSNPDTDIMHLTFNKVLPNGDIDDAFKPMKDWVGVKHGSPKYIELSTKKIDNLLKKLGVDQGLAQFSGDISVLASKEFKKEFGQEEFEAEVYENQKEEEFKAPNGEVVKFKRHVMDLLG